MPARSSGRALYRLLASGLLALLVVVATVVIWRRAAPPLPPLSDPPRQYLSLPAGPWGEGPRGAMAQTGREVDGFVVAVGQIEWRGESSRFQAERTDWSVLARSRPPVILSLATAARVHPTDDAGWSAALDALSDAAQAATERGLVVEGMQLDARQAPGGPREWAPLARAFSEQWNGGEYVLSLAVPSRWVGDNSALYPLAREFHRLIVPWPWDWFDEPDNVALREWLNAMASLRRPWLILLPGPAAPGSSASATGGPPSAGPGPSTMARSLALLRHAAPPGLEGWVWNGLPAADGSTPWTWAAMRAVMQGRAPKAALNASIVRVNPYIFEIWLQNAGDKAADEGSEARFIIYWRGRVPDDLAMREPYYLDHTRTIVRGPVPRPGQRVKVCEFALLDTSPGLYLPAVGSAGLAW